MKKKDYDYFQAFTQAVDYSCQAAEILKNTLTYFDTDKLNDRLKDGKGRFRLPIHGTTARR